MVTHRETISLLDFNMLLSIINYYLTIPLSFYITITYFPQHYLITMGFHLHALLDIEFFLKELLKLK